MTPEEEQKIREFIRQEIEKIALENSFNNDGLIKRTNTGNDGDIVTPQKKDGDIIPPDKKKDTSIINPSEPQETDGKKVL